MGRYRQITPELRGYDKIAENEAINTRLAQPQTSEQSSSFSVTIVLESHACLTDKNAIAITTLTFGQPLRKNTAVVSTEVRNPPFARDEAAYVTQQFSACLISIEFARSKTNPQSKPHIDMSDGKEKTSFVDYGFGARFFSMPSPATDAYPVMT